VRYSREPCGEQFAAHHSIDGADAVRHERELHGNHDGGTGWYQHAEAARWIM
jgi:hypothetical protein